MPEDRSDKNIDLEKMRLDLDRYKAQLDFRKFVLGSVCAAIAVAAIPPAFQLATAVLEYVKSEAQLKVDQENKRADELARKQQFRDGYVKDFISTALNQDIELRLRFAEYFSFVASDGDIWKNYRDELKAQRAASRTEIDRLETEWERAEATSPRNSSQENLLDRHLKWAYNEVGYVPKDRSATSNPRAPDQARGLGISLASIAVEKRVTAQQILDAFASAGFGQFQQVAALANAIAESNLNPNAIARDGGGQSIGLFQLNPTIGFGRGRMLEELMSPDVNIGIVVTEAKKYPAFTNATSLDEAVSVFVRYIMRPSNVESQVINRQRIARQIFQA